MVINNKEKRCESHRLQYVLSELNTLAGTGNNEG